MVGHEALVLLCKEIFLLKLNQTLKFYVFEMTLSIFALTNVIFFSREESWFHLFMMGLETWPIVRGFASRNGEFRESDKKFALLGFFFLFIRFRVSMKARPTILLHCNFFKNIFSLTVRFSCQRPRHVEVVFRFWRKEINDAKWCLVEKRIQCKFALWRN